MDVILRSDWNMFYRLTVCGTRKVSITFKCSWTNTNVTPSKWMHDYSSLTLTDHYHKAILQNMFMLRKVVYFIFEYAQAKTILRWTRTTAADAETDLKLQQHLRKCWGKICRHFIEVPFWLDHLLGPYCCNYCMAGLRAVVFIHSPFLELFSHRTMRVCVCAKESGDLISDCVVWECMNALRRIISFGILYLFHSFHGINRFLWFLRRLSGQHNHV